MRSKATLTLMEQTVMLLVFALAAALCVRIFVYADQTSRRYEARDRAVLEAQNLAERLYAEDDAAAELSRSGFAEMGESWVLTEKDYTLEAVINEETQESGILRVVTITGKMGDKELFSIPSSRYIPGEVAQ